MLIRDVAGGGGVGGGGKCRKSVIAGEGNEMRKKIENIRNGYKSKFPRRREPE